MDYQTVTMNDATHIKMSGQFIYNDNQKFKQIVEMVETTPMKSLQLHLSAVEFMDSAGLGMLLLLRDICEAKKIELSLHAPTGQVQKVFNISKFDQLFTIVP